MFQEHIEIHRHLNLAGLHCPIPVISYKAALSRLPTGAFLKITTNNMDALREITNCIRRGNGRLVNWHMDGAGCHFLVQRATAPPPRGRRRAVSIASRCNQLLRWLRGAIPAIGAA